MSGNLSLEAKWERLDSGPPEERVCFAAISIRGNGFCLTEAEDRFVGRIRQEIHLSAYRLAEWFAWNWWRLRWEPRKHDEGWGLAHRMATIGGGYVWPNITIFSDGERVALMAKPTQPRPAEPARYITDRAFMVRAAAFEGTIDSFLNQVCGQLRLEKLTGTNLPRIWADVLAERADPEATKWRRLEAMLGFDPDEAEPSVVEGLINDSNDLGEDAVSEIAAGHLIGTPVVTAQELRDRAASLGFEAYPRDAVRLSPTTPLAPLGDTAAWKRGTEAASFLREQEYLGINEISDKKLSEMASVDCRVLTADQTAAQDFSFALDETDQIGRVVLRSKWKTGRRFELARLLGDRIAGAWKGRLFPATPGRTYRQKLQRSFAAELLCPFAALEEVLGGDYSTEAIEDAANHFAVSELMVQTILVNHKRLDREDLERDIEAA